MYKFDKCIYDSLTIDEFEGRWGSLLEAYGLEKNKWFELIYEFCEQWVPVFLKDTFFSGMSTSQRSESMNSFFDGYIGRKTCLKEFVEQYDLALQKRYNDEERADFQTRQTSPHLKTPSPFEVQMSSIYTLEVFKKLQDEIFRIASCTVIRSHLEGEKEILEVKEAVVKSNGKLGTKHYMVEWDGQNITICCICRLFELKGYLCRHAMLILFSKDVYEIPRRYILKRWCRDATSIDVFDEACTGVKEDSPEYTAQCFTDLCYDCIKFAEQGSLSKDRYKVVKKILKEAFETMASLDVITHTVKEGDQNSNKEPDQIILDPHFSISKGRPSSKRIKHGVEISKASVRKCRQPGHNITKCPEMVQAQHTQARENFDTMESITLDTQEFIGYNMMESLTQHTRELNGS